MESFSLLINPSHPLSPDYVPPHLVMPRIPFAPEESRDKELPTKAGQTQIPFAKAQEKGLPEKYFMEQEAAACLERLFERGISQGIRLYGVSGYRSYHRQASLYQESLRMHGPSHTALYVAAPGCSEHQSGLAMDVSIPSLHYELEEVFGKTKEGKWLKQFAPLYGFIIRYPKGVSHITGFACEPWHIRYVTKPLAVYLSKTHLTLEEYHLQKEQHR